MQIAPVWMHTNTHTHTLQVFLVCHCCIVFFNFYNILYCVILHWYREPFLVEFCKVYGIANTSKYIAPDAFCHVLTFYFFLFLFCFGCDMFEFVCLFWYVRPSVWVFVKWCTLLYYFYFYICWYWSRFRLNNNKYHFEFCVLCNCLNTQLFCYI